MNEEIKAAFRARLDSLLHERPDLTPKPEQRVIKSRSLVRPDTFEGRRGGEQKWFTKQRQKNRIRNKLARAARKKR